MSDAQNDAMRAANPSIDARLPGVVADGTPESKTAGRNLAQAPVLSAELVYRRRYARTWHITDDGNKYQLAYDGYGLGFETVSIDGVEVARRSGFGNMSRRYSFPFGDRQLALSVAVSRWTDFILLGGLTFVQVEIDDHVVYKEGHPPQRPLPVTVESQNTTVHGVAWRHIRKTIPFWLRPFQRRAHKVETAICLAFLCAFAVTYILASRWTFTCTILPSNASTLSFGLWEGGIGLNHTDEVIRGIQRGWVIQDAKSWPNWIPIVNRPTTIIVITSGWVKVSCNFVPIWCFMLVPALRIVSVIRVAPKYLQWFCQECGYNLKGSLSGVCPECGTQKITREWPSIINSHNSRLRLFGTQAAGH